MPDNQLQKRITEALSKAEDTRILEIGRKIINDIGDIFIKCFGYAEAIVIADTNTFQAAGKRVVDVLKKSSIKINPPFIFDIQNLHAEYKHIQALCNIITQTNAIPISVGSGTINDLTKLSAHLCGRRYLSVPTAASMDGYTAYGASINKDGSKETFFCPAPLALVADLDIIACAPSELNAAGYGDLMAKIPSGADWIIADALGIEKIDLHAWEMVQRQLRNWISQPDKIKAGDPSAIRDLIEGLLMTGFAMQWCKTSRPASGADHQFSHLWDMQNHVYKGITPLHGFKVAIGTMASTLLYEQLFDQDVIGLNIMHVCENWISEEEVLRSINETFFSEELRVVAIRECKAKYIDRSILSDRLNNLKIMWPDLKKKLQAHLIPFDELREMFAAAGAPDYPGLIGIDLSRLRLSYNEARQIRRRYTILDAAYETGKMGLCLDEIFIKQKRFENSGRKDIK